MGDPEMMEWWSEFEGDAALGAKVREAGEGGAAVAVIGGRVVRLRRPESVFERLWHGTYARTDLWEIDPGDGAS